VDCQRWIIGWTRSIVQLDNWRVCIANSFRHCTLLHIKFDQLTLSFLSALDSFTCWQGVSLCSGFTGNGVTRLADV
jgi:hypothetical protein